MRKLVVLCTALGAVIATPAVALAQDYDVSAKTSPATAGSAKKPKTVSLGFNVQSNATARPFTSREFKVTFGGLKVNTKGVKTCTVAALNAAQSDAGCNKAAKIGSGYVKNLVGVTADPNDRTLVCNLQVTLYNAGNGALAVWLRGGPTIQTPAGACAPLSGGLFQALNGKLSNSSKGFSLSFAIPNNLMHPVDGLSQGIDAIDVTIAKKTIGSGKSKTGVVQAVGGCKGGKRTITLDLTPEAGGSNVSTGSAKC